MRQPVIIFLLVITLEKEEVSPFISQSVWHQEQTLPSEICESPLLSETGRDLNSAAHRWGHSSRGTSLIQNNRKVTGSKPPFHLNLRLTFCISIQPKT